MHLRGHPGLPHPGTLSTFYTWDNPAFGDALPKSSCKQQVNCRDLHHLPADAHHRSRWQKARLKLADAVPEKHLLLTINVCCVTPECLASQKGKGQPCVAPPQDPAPESPLLSVSWASGPRAPASLCNREEKWGCVASIKKDLLQSWMASVSTVKTREHPDVALPSWCRLTAFQTLCNPTA